MSKDMKQPFLNEDDFASLLNFEQQCSDGDGYTADKETVKRLAELGVLRSEGFGRYSVTAFGFWLIETEFMQAPRLPLRTIAEHNAREKAGHRLYIKGTHDVAWGNLPPIEREKWRVAAEREAS